MQTARHHGSMPTLCTFFLAAGCGSPSFVADTATTTGDLLAMKVADYSGTEVLTAQVDAITEDSRIVSLPVELAQDTPDAAVMALTPADIVVSLDGATSKVRSRFAKDKASHASVVFRLAGAQDEACMSELAVGPFELTIEDGSVSIDPAGLPIPTDALALLGNGRLALCAETWADFDGTISLGEVTFETGSLHGHEERVKICHIPPGDESQKKEAQKVHTITVGSSAVDAHLDHGDYLGKCDRADDHNAAASHEDSDDQSEDSDDPSEEEDALGDKHEDNGEDSTEANDEDEEFDDNDVDDHANNTDGDDSDSDDSDENDSDDSDEGGDGNTQVETLPTCDDFAIDGTVEFPDFENPKRVGVDALVAGVDTVVLGLDLTPDGDPIVAGTIINSAFQTVGVRFSAVLTNGPHAGEPTDMQALDSGEAPNLLSQVGISPPNILSAVDPDLGPQYSGQVAGLATMIVTFVTPSGKPAKVAQVGAFNDLIFRHNTLTAYAGPDASGLVLGTASASGPGDFFGLASSAGIASVTFSGYSTEIDDLVYSPVFVDCNNNGLPDRCDVTSGSSQDTNGNDIPDECDDTDGDGVINSADACPGTPAGDAVNADGCTIITLSANAGPDVTASQGDTVNVVGQGSVLTGDYDPATLVFTWAQTGGDPASFSFSSPPLAVDTTGTTGPLAFTLTVSTADGSTSTTDSFVIDVAAPVAPKIVSASSGDWHNAFLFNNGTIRSWGSNKFSQFGDGSLVAGIAAVDTGGLQTIVAKNDGTAWMFGWTAEGQSAVPIQISGAADIVQVGALVGGGILLQGDGTVLGFGRNNNCEMGGSSSGTVALRPIPGLPTNIVAIDAGALHVVALDANGAAWVWGWVFGCVPRIVLEGVTAVAAGDSGHCLFLREDETAWSIGFNLMGALGNGTRRTSYFTPTQVVGLTGVVDIDAGDRHSMFLRNDGTLWTCGWNRNGRLGLSADELASAGTDLQRGRYLVVPQQVGLTDVAMMSGGQAHSVAVQSDGTVWAWGYNFNESLSGGTLTSLPSGTVTAFVNTPVQIDFGE